MTGLSEKAHAHMLAKLFCLIAACFLSASLLSAPLSAQTKRVVVIKIDGLPNYLVDEYVNQRDPATGKSMLPWFDYIFYQRGTRLPNFYVRGMSISGPSWSMLDTGQHLQIKSNVEYDRLTLHSYDYLNFFPFYVNSLRQNRADMPGVEVLDNLKIPLLLDSYKFENRLQGFQLYQRGIRWLTLGRGTGNRFANRPAIDLATDWTIGFEMRSLLTDQVEHELIENLKNPDIRYFDYYSGAFDHAAHHDNNRDSLVTELKTIDALLGRIWIGIQKSPLVEDTALIILSDHGMNNDPKIRSQGYNLVNLLGSADGGAHHVITKRRLLLDYSIKGLDPLVPLITTASANSYYLKNESEDYPTALLDFDGNERAAIHLRNNDLNILHILLKELAGGKLDSRFRQATIRTFFATLDRRREEWATETSEIREELVALRSIIKDQKMLVDSLPTKWSADDIRLGLHVEALRAKSKLLNLIDDEKNYAEYVRVMDALLSLKKDNFDIKRLKISDVIPRRSMGDANSIHDLQNYVAGIAARGLALDSNNNLDTEKSFKRIDYPALLKSIALRNNVQPEVGNRPVDFLALRVPRESLIHRLADHELPTTDAILLYGGNDKQALVLIRNENTDAGTGIEIKYLPISNFREDELGNASFKQIE
ncbi:MAG: alkaline phosphatase family protein, partial [Pyrinomonadaceae bacterium]